MDMQYAQAVTAHEEAQRRRPSVAVLTNYLGSRNATDYPDIRDWPRGLACL
jgi:hypothetical protein